MKDHESKGERNQPQVSPADPLHQGVRRTGRNAHVDRTDEESFSGSGVTIAASFWKISGVDGGASVGGAEDVVHTVTGCTVGDALRSTAHGEAVITIGKGRHSVGGQVVAKREALIVMAAPAGGHGDAGRVHERSGIFGCKDEMLAVTVAAYGSAGNAILHGLTVHACEIGLRDIRMALRAGCGNIEVIYFGAGILGWKDSVASMAVRARGGRFVAIHDCPAMHALPIEFDGVRKRNLMA